MKLNDYIKVEVYGKKPSINFLKKLYYKYFNVSTNSVFLIRKMLNTKNNFFKKMLSRKLFLKYGIHIDHSSKIDIGLSIAHPQSIFINKVKIGKNCRIYQEVTIGRKNIKNKHNLTEIGDNVTIYSGAKILGDIKIGNNVIIGAGSIVTRDVDDNLVVAGNPAKIISKNTGELNEK